MTTHTLRVRSTPLADLHQHPDNPRNGDVELIAESLALNGQFKPIVVARDGIILAGNHTYQAALSLGWTHIAAVTLDLDPHSPEARRIMVADNRTSDVGMYDEAQLLSILRDLEPNLVGTGYTADDLEALTHLWDDPLDLDDLVNEHGDVLDTDRMIRLVLMVEPATAKAWRERVRDRTDDALLTELLTP